MKKLEPMIHDESNGLDYVLAGDYYIPDIRLDGVTNHYPIGKWGRMHRDYQREANPFLYNDLVLKGTIFTYLSDLNEQAQDRYDLIVRQMMKTEGVTEDLKRRSQMEWVRAMYNIANRAEEIVKHEMIYV